MKRCDDQLAHRYFDTEHAIARQQALLRAQEAIHAGTSNVHV
ncbi:MAG: hypothetical protein ACYDAQ_08210 [Mycobacteriales bacterium]